MNLEHGTYEIALGGQTLIVRASDKLHCNKYTWKSKRHCNGEFELHMILKGACRVVVEDQFVSLKEKQAILIAPGQYHQPTTEAGEFERFSVSFSLPEGALLACVREKVPTFCLFDVDLELERICRSAFYESAAGNQFQREMMQALLTQLIICVERRLHLAQTPPDSLPTAVEDSRVDQIDTFFEQHFADHAGRATLAKLLHLSERQLVRVLRATYGMGFQEKLISTRMDHAAWLLRTTDQKIGEIAANVGYTSEAAFYQVFRKHFQMTPERYRIRCKV